MSKVGVFIDAKISTGNNKSKRMKVTSVEENNIDDYFPSDDERENNDENFTPDKSSNGLCRVTNNKDYGKRSDSECFLYMQSKSRSTAKDENVPQLPEKDVNYIQNGSAKKSLGMPKGPKRISASLTGTPHAIKSGRANFGIEASKFYGNKSSCGNTSYPMTVLNKQSLTNNYLDSTSPTSIPFKKKEVKRQPSLLSASSHKNTTAVSRGTEIVNLAKKQQTVETCRQALKPTQTKSNASPSHVKKLDFDDSSDGKENSPLKRLQSNDDEDLCSPLSPPTTTTTSVHTKPYLIGFKNYGNTCYLNSTIQCLMALEPFKADLKNENASLSILLAPLQSLLRYINEGNSFCVDATLEQIRDIFIDKIDNTFNNYKHQDASEFISKLLNFLSETILQTAKRYFSFLNKEKTFVEENFESKIAERHTCKSCEKVRKSDQTHLFWYLPVPTLEDNEVPSVQAIIDKMFKPHQSKCTNCNEEEGLCHSKIVSLPRVLIIQLKRYNNEGDKLMDPVLISPVLNFDKHISEKCSAPMTSRFVNSPNTVINGVSITKKENDTTNEWEDESEALEKSLAESIAEQKRSEADEYDLKEGIRRSILDGPVYNWTDVVETIPSSFNHAYRLVGIVNHHGYSATSGHYRAFVYRNETSSWYDYNDRNVFEEPVSTVYNTSSQQNSYLLFYMHKKCFEESKLLLTSTTTVNCTPTASNDETISSYKKLIMSPVANHINQGIVNDIEEVPNNRTSKKRRLSSEDEENYRGIS